MVKNERPLAIGESFNVATVFIFKLVQHNFLNLVYNLL
jgi:hypothetical protein